MPIPVFAAIRYVQALREGGSLPAVVDTNGGGMFVVKFRGAGQGVKTLIAELIVGMLAERAGLPVPDMALVDVAETFGRAEPDPEIQDLLRASHGLNFGARYLDGAFNFDGHAASGFIDAGLAARIVWFDAFVSNPDRTARNPNLMICERKPFLIDHGAAIYAQHDWPSVDDERTHAPFRLIDNHVLLKQSSSIVEVDREMTSCLEPGVIREVVELVPDDFFEAPALAADFATPRAARERYAGYLESRLSGPRRFVEEAEAARRRAAHVPKQRLSARR